MKSYKFYRNFAIICGVLFLFATVVFIIGSVKFLYLNPYENTSDSLRVFLSATLIFQIYMVYMVIGCYKKWKRRARYMAYERKTKRSNRKNAEYTAFINNHFDF